MNEIQFTLKDFTSGQRKIGVVGLGYVGLPLLLSFEKHFSMIGFDISEKKIADLKAGIDETHEVGNHRVRESKSLFTSSANDLAQCDLVIIAVPTPIDDAKTPNLDSVIGATEAIAQNLKKGAVLVYESTVYPGVTEEVCKPILESYGYLHKKDFHLGYSPERINPGDKSRSFESILKIVAGDNSDSLKLISQVYNKVVTAGVYEASSIKVAEAAKVIENVQRDVNIALINELAIVFEKMNLDTSEVLEAAGTKWNFIKLSPGLVGGHCIGVDPYYLTHKAEKLGYHPEVITSGRRINDSMPKYVAEQTVKKLIESGARVKDANVLISGLTFKEDVPDTRNSKVKDLIEELKQFSCKVYAQDPYVEESEIEKIFGAHIPEEHIDVEAFILAVPHKGCVTIDSVNQLASTNNGRMVLIDVKSFFPLGTFGDNILHWRL
ncbi:MAG: nucleotide sugar dehydrogenase [bacterium]|nr:nucleotide sugar dehydrogenase [bacterium]